MYSRGYPLDPFGICYTIECKGDYIIVSVGDLKVEYMKEGQEITLPRTKYLYGKLVCPNIKSACVAQKITNPNYDILSDSPPPTEVIPSEKQTQTQVEETKHGQDPSLDEKNKPTIPEKVQEEKKKTATIASSVAVILVAIIIVAGAVVFIIMKKNKDQNNSDSGIGNLQV